MILVAPLIISNLPTYSPEFNPAEHVFNKLKTILKHFEFQELLRDYLHLAVYGALKTITQEDFIRFAFHMHLTGLTLVC